MGKSDYYLKLKDSRWQKKRLDIFERDGWKCKFCECGLDDGISLHIHHTYYIFGNNPWDYEEKSLITLCDECHYAEQECIKKEKQILLNVLCSNGATSSDLNMIYSDLCAAFSNGETVGTFIDMIIDFRKKSYLKKKVK